MYIPKYSTSVICIYIYTLLLVSIFYLLLSIPEFQITTHTNEIFCVMRSSRQSVDQWESQTSSSCLVKKTYKHRAKHEDEHILSKQRFLNPLPLS